jgi:hypothetical protein
MGRVTRIVKQLTEVLILQKNVRMVPKVMALYVIIIIIMEWGYLLTRSVPTHPEVSSMVFPGFFCLLGVVSY